MMAMHSRLSSEKLQQALGLLGESDLDAWLLFVRETAEGSDPVLPLILEGGLTWQSALILHRDGRKVAVVGNYDADPLCASGDWDDVVPYVQSIREPLREQLKGVRRLGLNFSTNDPKADGLTHGMFLLLQKHLEGLQLEYVSAERLAMSLRGRKTPEEVRRMKAAIAATDEMFADIERFAQVGRTEREVYDHVHRLVRERGLGFSWDPAGDPIVNSGPDSMIGHGIPSDKIRIEPGHIFHVDLGLIVEGYSSDIQRCWYVGGEIPIHLLKAMKAVGDAISAGADVLRPGVPGWVVDEAARTSLVNDGYDEYLHAFGHQVGRVAHDGGTILGPRWERYGETPNQEVEEGEVYTLELGVTVPGRGYLGIEEMVQVTSDGIEWLSDRQTTLRSIPANDD
jgi:Xaa-Pro dipeptidase